MTRLSHTIGVTYSDVVEMSHQGMAHFAGTGPEGKTCKDCSFYVPHPRRGRSRACRKFFDLTRQWSPPESLPSGALACRHFEQEQAT